MGHLDGEAREAAARRQVAVRQEQLARDETSAYFAAYVRGRHGPMHEGAAPHLSRPLSVPFLFCTSGKDSHSQAGSTTGADCFCLTDCF